MIDDTYLKVAMLDRASEIAVAYFGQNRVLPEQIPTVLANILSGLTPAPPEAPPPRPREPAVPIKHSIQPDYIVCLEDGEKKQSMKKYLRTKYGLTPEEYRKRWGLPADYPMVAPSYSARRSQYAKDRGLGRNAPSISKPNEVLDVVAPFDAIELEEVPGGEPEVVAVVPWEFEDELDNVEDDFSVLA